MLLPRDFLVLICICLVFVCCCKFTYQASKDTEQEISGQCFVSDEGQCSGEEKLKYSQDKNIDIKEEKWGKYIEQIEKAVKNYQKCDESNCYFSQIISDLKPWSKNGISEKLIKEASQIQRMSHYQIINHKLYRNNDPMFPARTNGIEHFILKIIKDLPDTEFVLNTMDWPQINRWSKSLPVFSFSKVLSDHSDIMYPAWTFWEGGPAVWPIYPNGLGRWDQQLKSITKSAKNWPWQKKQKKAFFRGSRTSPERDPLVLLSRKEPNLIDASYTKNQGWKSDADTLGAKPATEISLEDHCEYKYLFNFRGVAASFRFKHLFLCNSLVFHVDDKWLEFFYPALKPWVHYIPVRQDLKDARELIQFAIENDNIAKSIAARGRNFVKEHLKLEDVTNFWKDLLVEYTKLLKFKPTLNKKFNKIQN